MEQKLSESEQYLWHFIETHILEIPDYSIVKLSERANVSTATIVRTMKKKGYEGFTSFKHHLKDKENQNINFSALEKVDRGIRTAILKNEEEVTRTINMIEIGNISLNGETQELVVAGKNCYDSEIGTILLTASKHSSLMKYIEIPFVGFKSEGSFFPDYEVRSRLPLSILARILLDAYALRTTT
ncbi:MurR/RpiR family transcriptional regulator [Enterococcus faecalis]